MELSELRRQNLRTLMDKYTATALARKLGYRQSSFLSQMAGPNPTREITEKTARAYEKQLDLPAGTLDRPVAALTTPAGVAVPETMATADMVALVLRATRTVGRICESEAITLPYSKFADLVVMGIVDATEHGGALREDHIKQVVSLLK